MTVRLLRLAATVALLAVAAFFLGATLRGGIVLDHRTDLFEVELGVCGQEDWRSGGHRVGPPVEVKLSGDRRP